MADGALLPLFSFLGWAFVPGWATSTVQNIYYRVTVPVGQSPPQPGTPIFARHHRRIRILVLTLYLLYTLLQSLYDVKLAGDFFTLLAVSPGSLDREIKSRFRRLAAKFHPDKIQTSTINPEDIKTSADAHFLALKVAQDTLLNPTLRFAYVRFGPSIVQTALPPSLKPSIGTYVYAGLKHNLLPSYLIDIVSLSGMNYFFLSKWGSYWRYYALTLIFAVELYFLTHSNPAFTDLLPSVVAKTITTPLQMIYGVLQAQTKLNNLLPPHLLPYQTLAVLRRLTISLNIFISQLAPPNQLPKLNESTAKSQMANLLNNINQSLTHFSTTAARTDQEATALLSLQLAPFQNDVAQTEKLRSGMQEGVLQGALMGDPGVRAAVDGVLQRRKGSLGGGDHHAQAL